VQGILSLTGKNGIDFVDTPAGIPRARRTGMKRTALLCLKKSIEINE